MTFVCSTTMAAAPTEAMPLTDVEVSFLTDPVEGPVFRSIVEHCQGGNSRRGRPRYEDRFTTGTASVTIDERTRRYDPSNTASPHSPNLVPNRRARILARYNSVTYVVFDGLVDAWPVHNDGSGRFALSLSDGSKALAKSTLSNSFFETISTLLRPKHWWALDETSGTVALDSGAGAPFPAAYSGVTVGQSAIVTYDGSRTAVSFNGTSDYIDVPAVALDNYYSLSHPVGTNKTTLFGFFTHPTVATNDRTLFAVRTTAIGTPPFETWSLYIESAGGNTGKLVASDELAADAPITDVSASRVDDDALHSWAWVSGVGLYVDGALASGNTSPPLLLQEGDKVVLGSYLAVATGAKSNYWAGDLSHVVMFDRALTATEIASLHSAGTTALSGDTTGTRIGRYLDYIGWSTIDRDLDTGASTLGAFNLSGSDALAAIQTLADTEEGQTYLGVDGAMSDRHTFAVVHRSRLSPITATRSLTSQATFRDRATSSGYPYSAITFASADELIANDVSRTRQGGNTQTAQDTASQRRYFKQSNDKTGLWASDNDALDLANMYLSRHKDAAVRVTSITINPLVDPTNLFPLVLGLEIGSRITVKWTPDGSGSEVSQETIIEGVEHDWSNEEWTTTWRLSPAETLPFWILGDNTYSVLGSTTRVAA